MELSSDYLRVGDMLSKTGHSAEALAHDERALALLESIPSGDDDLSLKLRLISVHTAAGRARVRVGDLAGAAAHDEQARRLLAGLRGNTREILRERTRINQNFGFLATLRGHWQEALADYLGNESVWRDQLAANPGDLTAKRLLMDSHEWVALARRDGGDNAGALTAHREALALCEEALAGDPTNVQANNDLADVLHEIGNTLLTQGDAAGALDHLRRAREHYTLVAAADVANVHAQRQRFLVEEESADALALAGDLSGALAKRQEDLPSLENLTRIDPANVEFQRDLAVCLEKIGEEKAGLGDVDSAGLFLRRAWPIFEHLSAISPTNAVARGDLARLALTLGRVCERSAGTNSADERHEASEWYRRSLELWRALQADDTLAVRDSARIGEVSAALDHLK